MSTKTTFKRIALVTVAALGFGLLSVAPSSAAYTTDIDAADGAGSFSLNASSMTVVGSGSGDYAVFEINTIGAGSGKTHSMISGQSVVATVTGWPTAIDTTTAAGDLTINGGSSAWSRSAGSITASSGTTIDDTDYNVDPIVDKGGDAIAQGTATTDYAGSAIAQGLYFLKVAKTSGKALDLGTYTVRIDLRDASGVVQRSFVKVTFVSTANDLDGGSITVTSTGSQIAPAASATVATADNNVKVQLKDANGGLIRTGNNVLPTLTAKVTDEDATSVSGLTLTETRLAVVNTVRGDGIYHLTSGQTLTGLTEGDAVVSVRYGSLTAGSGDLVLTTTAGTANFLLTAVSATGKVVTGTTNYYAPLTTKSATVSATLYSTNLSTTAVAVGSTSVYYSLSYSGCVLGDMSPAATTTPTKLTTDANGGVSVAITNANPIDSCYAQVVFSNAGVYTNNAAITNTSLTRRITWATATPTSVVVSPAGPYKAILGSTNKITWTILDQYSAPVVGSTVTFAPTGANAPATTTTAPSAISDANGQVSYSWTDAAGVVASTTKGFDTVALAKVGLTDFAQGSIKVTYVTTMPAIASLYSTYTTTDITTAGTTSTGLVPTTNIGGTTGVATSAADQIDTTKVITASSATKLIAPWVTLNFEARTSAAVATTGVPTTVTVTGAKIIGNNGKLGTSVTVYANESVYVLGTAAGIATVTATNGTVSKVATINFVNASGDARVLSLTESAGLVTATVKDAFGSVVSGVSVNASGSGGAWLGNGSTSSTFTTSTDGTVTFAVTGAGTITASLTTTGSGTKYVKALNLANSGNATGTVVTTGAPAGVASASVTTLGRTDAATAAATAATAAATAAIAAATAASAAAAKAGADAVAASAAAQAAAVAAAEAAADAAAEATDAANAATDAANASAEAGDAATAAAQDAADAVAALSTQVSEMMSALKAQLTALTNLVIKIQKKVKA